MSYSSLDLVFMGPPGSGKRTQAGILAERYRIPLIATADLLHDEVTRGSELGSRVGDLVDRGLLVPDEVVGGLVLHQLYSDACARGFLLDGYPRTLEQAGRLDATLAELGRSIERVVLFTVSDDVAIRRLNGRRVHWAAAHESDDLEEVARRRLAAYREQTAPVAEIYRRRGLLIEIDGNRDHGEVTEDVLRVVGVPVGA